MKNGNHDALGIHWRDNKDKEIRARHGTKKSYRPKAHNDLVTWSVNNFVLHTCAAG